MTGEAFWLTLPSSPGSAPLLLHVREEQASGTSAGAFTSGAWRTRTLNTVKTNEIAGASLASNQITLPAGTYEVDASAPAIFIDKHQARLYNVTAAAELIVGTAEMSANSTGGWSTRSVVRGRFTLAVSSTVELQHRCTVTNTVTNAMGQAASFGTEVYADVVIREIS